MIKIIINNDNIMLMILLLTLYQQLNNKIIVLFKWCLLITMFNIFKIELININT